MKNYVVQNGCHNCKHCLVHIPMDDPTYYFCKLTTKKKQPSVYSGNDYKKSSASSLKHMDWRMSMTEVCAAGKCDCFKRNQ